jgi:hypothetical protein
MSILKRIVKPVKEVSDIVDKFVLTKEEKIKFEQELNELLQNRWLIDSKTDSWLTKSVRPILVASSVWFLYILVIANGFGFTVQSDLLDIFKTILISMVSGYFVLRTIDKKIK